MHAEWNIPEKVIRSDIHNRKRGQIETLYVVYLNICTELSIEQSMYVLLGLLCELKTGSIMMFSFIFSW